MEFSLTEFHRRSLCTHPNLRIYTMFTAGNSRHSDGMFSALVSHSDGTLSRYSASTSHTGRVVQSELIAFLSIVQKCNVHYLSITWQPALSTLGAGGSGTISQSKFMPGKPKIELKYMLSTLYTTPWHQ